MKKEKLNLSSLKVTSFVTNQVKGGRVFTSIIRSNSGICICPTEDCETEVACDLTDDCPIVKQ